jgi:hypothetical protein
LGEVEIDRLNPEKKWENTKWRHSQRETRDSPRAAVKEPVVSSDYFGWLSNARIPPTSTISSSGHNRGAGQVVPQLTERRKCIFFIR